jgi:hypothetical protein
MLMPPLPAAHYLQLSPIDASPLLLKTLNSPALKFDHDLEVDRLQQATAALLLEYPIIGGRYVAFNTTHHKIFKRSFCCVHLLPHKLLTEQSCDCSRMQCCLCTRTVAGIITITNGKLKLPHVPEYL